MLLFHIIWKGPASSSSFWQRPKLSSSVNVIVLPNRGCFILTLIPCTFPSATREESRDKRLLSCYWMLCSSKPESWKRNYLSTFQLLDTKVQILKQFAPKSEIRSSIHLTTSQLSDTLGEQTLSTLNWVCAKSLLPLGLSLGLSKFKNSTHRSILATSEHYTWSHLAIPGHHLVTTWQHLVTPGNTWSPLTSRMKLWSLFALLLVSGGTLQTMERDS